MQVPVLRQSRSARAMRWPFAIDLRYLTNVMMERLSSSHRRKPSPNETRRQRRDELKLDRAATKNIHRHGGDDADQNKSHIKVGHLYSMSASDRNGDILCVILS